MKITILAVGRIKEKYLADAIAEYSKRLNRYCRLEVIQVQDEKDSDKPSEAVKKQILTKEAARIAPHIKEDSFVIALAINGRQLSSEELAGKIDSLGISGISNITFIIGGSLGLSDEILKKADMLLSFSKMTFPHQLMRVILLEQIYRGYKIISGEPYHK
jgi:23S rRNA (pseudouridine1915-N3)-methyltransferase